MLPKTSGMRLTKNDAERLMAAVDSDSFIAVLRASLERLLPECPAPESWPALIGRAGDAAAWGPQRIEALTAMDIDALYDLAAELNEQRTLR